ncbi:MAG: acyl-CoA dehydrogenase [Ignavibacteria bacterium GWB2_35_12]|nr:MAG: acyl-CoA dehydrogenase [Ignavibacteria bacterium GWA2_35_8]OGU39686.1 MAG: acyl-CoA dehydrogenase [Ignavibacteria bacterium GWB2_35_12]OGU96448.1 MAG: acyl-CoA dehydrogenase [Ignavibacteria bacterium RIFOXYA2_FULL_35_10]OGV23881.1 MAG: acyl-CoA dehydrogenase [Ignavibacteria bacterium RIFOXYC2_FULL_35_21]
MDYQLNETQKLIQQTFKSFVDARVKPQAEAIDINKEFPHELFKDVGELGFYGMRYPVEAGGSGLDILSYCLAVTELARGSLSLAAACSMQSLMATYFLYRFGDDEIKTNYFTPALTGEKIGTICMTEPNAGSDLYNITTTAKVTDDEFILNGQKIWITASTVADFMTVLSRTDNHEKLSFFLVPSHFEGVHIGKSIDKLGVRGSITGEISFDNVKIPKNYLLGAIGEGTKSLLEILAEIRIMTAALAYGVSLAAFEDSLEYAKTRVQFGKPIGKFQLIQSKFADIAVKLETMKQMIYHTAKLCDLNLPRQKEAAIVKLYASECANSICDEASRVMASYGYAMEYPMQRYLRDARFTLIGGGTNEILKINIAKELGL